MFSTVWSIACLLFFYSRCLPRAQTFVKVGARAPPCPMESAPLLKCLEQNRAFRAIGELTRDVAVQNNKRLQCGLVVEAKAGNISATPNLLRKWLCSYMAEKRLLSLLECIQAIT